MNRHWTVKLDDVAEINPRAPKHLADDDDVAFVPMSAVSENGSLCEHGTRPYAEVKKGYTYFERGDILVAKITPCFENGKAALVDNLVESIGFGSTEFHVLRPGPDLDGRYLFYMLWNDKFRAVAASGMTGSAGQKRVPAELLRRTEIRLPPLDEQRRIAAILDKADALRQKRKRAIALLDSLTQSIFSDLFGDPARNRLGLPVGKIGDLLESATYGSSGKAGPTGEYPMLRMGNLTNAGQMDYSDLKYIDLVDSEIDRYTVQRGDILFNRTNSAELVGKTAVFDREEPYAYAGYLVRARTKSGYSPEYVSGYLNSSHGKKTLRGMAKSIVGMANINAKEMQTIPILIPDQASQQQYTRLVAGIREREGRCRASLTEVDNLFASLQHRAFSGQL